jgi:imidazolonepropionase-like amidohydrolase/Tol biopolymer transport system component
MRVQASDVARAVSQVSSSWPMALAHVLFSRQRFLLAVVCVAACKVGRRTDGPPTVVVDAGAAGIGRTPTVPAETADEPALPGKGEEPEPPPWNVDDPPGDEASVKIDVDEGTWMSLDVSPDGKTIAFDLLGDLYTLPIGGGTARALTSGMAWDMQPRFSPDGRFVAFTSDRGGGDNIWVLPVGGGDARAVTKEDFRLVNSPAWSPDGSFIVAHKHFTAERSLGSGEMWLWHVAGGDGLRMTKKPNDQQDVGEPMFGPEGRWLWFSQDVTPGPVFQYNKDPHAGIYAVKRLDREEGRTETVLSGPGGAVRPTPSPDGKSLAYVRRLGLRTALFVHDLQTGAERPLDTALDRDMQETWAIHGVYPAFAWTPDSRDIVIWAGGKIRRIAAAGAKSGTSVEIPFRVTDSRKVSAPLRFPVDVHPAAFRTKMLRWVQVAPGGKAVVYSAMGKLWLKDLKSGRVRRVTRDENAFEFYPAFSRDGRSIVYTSWNDTTLGRVRIVPAAGGSPRDLVRTPGHYVEPAVSPDGKVVVFRKVTGGDITSPRGSKDPGVWMVPIRGGEPTLVTRDGSDPHFGAGSDRVFLEGVQPGKGDDDPAKRTLFSVELDGKDPRTHLVSEMATRFRVSPDGRFVAFQEQFRAHVRPFVLTGTAADVGPKDKGMPVATVSRDAGEWLHWSGDSKQLHWALGPDLYTRDLKDTFAWMEGAPAELPKPEEKGVDIGFLVDSDVPKGRVALVHGRVVTMKGDEVIADGVVLVDGNRIAAVGAHGKIEIPRDARIVDVTGKTIVPGLVDVHAHGAQGENGFIPQDNWLHYATLAFGVTTVHDPSNDTAEIFTAAEMARAGTITAPRIFSTGTILYGARASFKAVIESLDDARSHLRRMKAVGAISVKSYNQPRRNQRQQVVAAARELQMMVVPEGGSLYQHNMTMVVDGHTGVEHALPIARGYDDVEQLWGATAVGYTPTTGVGYGGLWGENYWYAHTNVFAHERLRTFVPPARIESRARRRLLASKGDWNHFQVAELTHQLADAGVRVNLGAHGQREGLAAHWELWMFVQGGMTPHEALRAGTLHGAQYLGLDAHLGSIEPGKLADLAVIDGDPLKDIRTSENVAYTMLNGRLFEAATMNQVAPKARVRPQLAWERDGAWTRPPGGTEAHAHGCSCGAG